MEPTIKVTTVNPRDLVNIANNATDTFIPQPGANDDISGASIAIIILLVLAILILLGNVFLSLYLYQMGGGRSQKTRKMVKDVEIAVYEIRKSCQAIKNASRAQQTKDDKKDEEEDNSEEPENKTVHDVRNSGFLTSTPERKEEIVDIEIISPIVNRSIGHTTPKTLASEDIKLTSFPLGFPSDKRNKTAFDEIDTAIDQSFNRLLDKVGRPPRNPNMTN